MGDAVGDVGEGLLDVLLHVRHLLQRGRGVAGPGLAQLSVTGPGTSLTWRDPCRCWCPPPGCCAGSPARPGAPSTPGDVNGKYFSTPKNISINIYLVVDDADQRQVVLVTLRGSDHGGDRVRL